MAGSAATSVRAPLLTAAGCLVATAADTAFDPQHTHVPMCPFHGLTGWWCPLCGGLRCVDALVHLDLPLAIRQNVVLVAMLPVVVFAWIAWLRNARDGRPTRLPRGRLVVLVGVLVAFTVVRNLPFADVLRPT